VKSSTFLYLSRAAELPMRYPHQQRFLPAEGEIGVEMEERDERLGGKEEYFNGL